jgi:hypothetical protein
LRFANTWPLIISEGYFNCCVVKTDRGSKRVVTNNKLKLKDITKLKEVKQERKIGKGN